MSEKAIVQVTRDLSQLSTARSDEQPFEASHRKKPQRVTVEPEHKILVSREEAAQLLSISQRGLGSL